MIFPDNLETKLGFNVIRAKIKESCISDLGKAEVENISFSISFQNIDSELNKVSEFKHIILFDVLFPVDNFVNGIPVLNRFQIEGQFAEIDEIALLRKGLDSFKNIISFFKNDEHKSKYPGLYSLCKDISHFPFLIERIDRIIDNNNRIKDNASPELGKIRKQKRQVENEVNSKIQSVLKQAVKDGYAEAGSTVSFRNGRPVIPLPAANKKMIRGLIHDESASGKTIFLEPSSVVELTNQVKELEYGEQREIRKLLIELANDIRPYSDELKENFLLTGKIDFIRAKALFARYLDAEKPILYDYPHMSWVDAYHPLLLMQNRLDNKKTIPLNISLNKKEHLLVISGPNAGGKSVCLKTVGLIQYMLQCGILVSVNQKSEFGVFHQILLDIGDEQSIENDLSTYSSHLLAMKIFLKNANEKSIVLIDEFGTGTEPILGGAIAEAVLDKLTALRVFGVITTHYSNLKHYASSNPGIINGAMMFDLQKLIPTYQLSIGRPGSSFAFEIARKIGLPEEVLAMAQEKVGTDHVDFDKNLRNILRDKRYWENKRENIRLNEKRLSQILERYDKELENVEKFKKDILGKAKAEADEIMQDANKRIENTIREIKEAQAEKEKTKQIREDFDKFKDGLSSDQQVDEIRKKKEKIQERKSKLAKHRPDLVEKKVKASKPEEVILQRGDSVLLKGQTTVGEIIEINGSNVIIAFGSLMTTVKKDKVEKVSKNKAKKITKNKNSVRDTLNITNRKLTFKDKIDIRGQRAEEAIQKVSEFIDEAALVGCDEVRILHGKGNGVLRQLIREYLETVPVVSTCRDEHIEMGGSGITVVNIAY